MTAPHGIIARGRTYANNSGAATTEAQDRRIAQEIFRDLAQYVPGVNIEQLAESLRDAFDEDGIDRDAMANLPRFYDSVRDRLVGISGLARRPFRVGDRVISTTGTAGGTQFDSIVGVGIIEELDGASIHPVKVRWPDGDDWWWHRSDELAHAEAPATGQTVSLAGIGLVPSIINQARRERFELSTAQDRALVQALLDDPRVRSALLNFSDDSYDQARQAVAAVLEQNTIFTEGARAMVEVYDQATEPTEKREKRARLAALRSQVADLERDLAA